MSAGARSPEGPGGPSAAEPASDDVAEERRLDPAEDPQAADGSAPGVRRRRRRQAGDGRRLWSVTVRLSLWERALVTSAAARAGGLSAGAWLAQAAVRQAEADIASASETDGGRDHEGASTVGEWPADAHDEPLTEAGAVGAGVVAGELRAAVRQLVRYGVLLNQLVAQVNATGDIEHLAGGLRVAVDRCETRSAAVAVLAAELATSAGVAASSTTRASAAAAASRRGGPQDGAGSASGGGGAG